MFGIGGFELVLILLFAFLVFGPDKLPEAIQTANKALQKFRKAQQEFDEVVKKEMVDEQALKSDNPLDMIDSAAKKVEKSQESFAQRKARYDRERQETLAKKPAPISSQDVADLDSRNSVNAEDGQAETLVAKDVQDSEDEPISEEEVVVRPAPAKAPRTGGAIPSADELYGVKPTARVRKAPPKSKQEEGEV